MSFQDSIKALVDLDQRQKPQAATGASKEYTEKVMAGTEQKVSTLESGKAELVRIIRSDIPNYKFTDEHIKAIQTFIENRVTDYTKKWFLVQGNFGSGKSYLFERAFQKWLSLYSNLRKRRYIYLSAHEVVSMYEKDGDAAFSELNKRNICIDDIGTEKEANRYGQKEEVMRRFLELRYNARHNVTTDIITNLTMSEITERYSERIESRLHETCVVLKLGARADSKDFRKL